MSYGGDKLPDMKSMVLVGKAIFSNCDNVVTLIGLRSKLTHLQVLDLQGCKQLRTCPGVDDLVNLEELNCSGCERLERLHNLGKLKTFRKLDNSKCRSIIELPGLGDLLALGELYGGLPSIRCPNVFKVLDVCKLRSVQVLDLSGRCLEAMPGFDNIISPQEVMANFREVVDWPSLWQLIKVQKMKIDGWSFARIRDLDNLTMLHSLHIHGCSGGDELLDFWSLISLQALSTKSCEYKDVSKLCNLRVLESLRMRSCDKLERLPDLQGLTRLKSLEVKYCLC